MVQSADRFLWRVALAGGAFALCYAKVFRVLAEQWATNPTYSYGFAVPLISGYIVWTRWSGIKDQRSDPDYYWGVPVVLSGLALLALGHVGAFMSIESTSAIVTLAGLVLLLAGRPMLRALSFPLAYLLLMLPVWSYPINLLQGPSQQVATVIATNLLRGLGIPAFQQGTHIVLSSVTLDVMRECSGINQLIALTVMTVPAAYLWLRGTIARAALVAVGVVVGYLGNGARITILGWLTADGYSVSDTHSAIHLIPGFVTASLAYLIIWGCVLLFARWNGSEDVTASNAPVPRRPLASSGRGVWTEAAVLGLLVSAGAGQLLATPRIIHNDRLSAIPRSIREWSVVSSDERSTANFPGFDVDLVGAYPTPNAQRMFVDVDQELLRTYRNGAGATVQLYVGYYGNQENGKELSGDVSRSLARVASPLAISSVAHGVLLSEVVQRTDTHRRGLIFWYDVNGRVLGSIYRAKGYTLLDRVIRQRSNGAVIMIAWDTLRGGETAREDAIAFAEALLPVLPGYLPS